MAADRRIDDLFVKLLERHIRQNQPVSPRSSKTFAPTVFAKHPEANGTPSKAFEAAMQRLLDAQRIVIRTEGPPSRLRDRLVFP
jgi:hypothetical protein